MLSCAVSKCVQQVAQPAFFLRLAEMAEETADTEQKAALERLATQVWSLYRLVSLCEVFFKKKNVQPSVVSISLPVKAGDKKVYGFFSVGGCLQPLAEPLAALPKAQDGLLLLV